MCAILGLFTNKLNKNCISDINIFYNKLYLKSIDRGRDGTGIVVINNKSIVTYTNKDVVTSLDFLNLINPITFDTSVVLQSCRAEPTNEYSYYKNVSNIQPFKYDGIFCVHNGTISNDKDILLNVNTPTHVDSYAIPYAIQKGQKNKLVGSMSYAYTDVNLQIPNLTLYKNYNPLSLFFIPSYNIYVFVSLDNYLEDVTWEMKLDYRKIKFKPFSTVVLKNNECRIVEDAKDFGKAVVICSGGLDSTVAAKIACMENSEVTLAHFTYGCRAEKQEIRAINNIYNSLHNSHPNINLKKEIIDLSFIKNLGGTSLVDPTLTITKGEIGVEYAHEWVPARNTVMIALIAAYCDRYNIHSIYLGLNLEESGAYRDNTVMFYRNFNEVLDIGTVSRPIIKNPLDNLMKHEIVKLALGIKAPIEYSWSCYHGDDIHCGNCGPCFLRSTAFKMNGLIDCIPYKVLPLNFWKGCKSINEF